MKYRFYNFLFLTLYWMPNNYCAQIEGAGLNFRFGYTCFGIAPKHSFWARTVRELPKWYRLFFPWSFSFNYHSGQADRIFRFYLTLGAFQMWYLTKGEGEEKGYTGFHSSWRGLKNYKKLF